MNLSDRDEAQQVRVAQVANGLLDLIVLIAAQRVEQPEVIQKEEALDPSPGSHKAAFCPVAADSAGARPGEMPLERLATFRGSHDLTVHDFAVGARCARMA